MCGVWWGGMVSRLCHPPYHSGCNVGLANSARRPRPYIIAALILTNLLQLAYSLPVRVPPSPYRLPLALLSAPLQDGKQTNPDPDDRHSNPKVDCVRLVESVEIAVELNGACNQCNQCNRLAPSRARDLLACSVDTSCLVNGVCFVMCFVDGVRA